MQEYNHVIKLKGNIWHSMKHLMRPECVKVCTLYSCSTSVKNLGLRVLPAWRGNKLIEPAVIERDSGGKKACTLL